MLRDWLENPIFVKHVRSRLRPQAMATSIAVTILICLCIVVGAYQSRSIGGPEGFSALMVLQFVLLAIMGSTQVGASIGSARASGILDFHRVSPQSPWELAIGFLFGAPVREYLLTALTIPFAFFFVMMGDPDFRGLVQAEVLLVAVALTLHAMSLLGGLTLKGAMSGQNALGFTVVIGIFVVGPLFGAFRLLSGLLITDEHLELFGFPLPWLAFVLLHLAAAFYFFMLATTRKMESERKHSLTKPQAVAAMSALCLLAIGGMSNWNVEGSFQMAALYVLMIVAMILVGLATPSLSEYDKWLRRARKLGIARLPLWDDFAPNRPTVAVICATLLATASIFGTTIDSVPGRGDVTRAGFPLSVAVAVMVAAYFGLSFQYFLLRFGRRASNFFGLFLFVAWALPLVLGIITIASIGPMNRDARPAMIFSATPIVGVTAASGVFESEAGSGPAMVAITLALLFAFVFNMLYTKAIRRVRMAVEESDPLKPEPDPLGFAPEPAPATG